MWFFYSKWPILCSAHQDHSRYVSAKYYWDLCNDEGARVIWAHILDPPSVESVAAASMPSKTSRSHIKCGTYKITAKLSSMILFCNCLKIFKPIWGSNHKLWQMNRGKFFFIFFHFLDSDLPEKNLQNFTKSLSAHCPYQGIKLPNLKGIRSTVLWLVQYL